MSHIPHAFQHARRLVLSSVGLFQPSALTVPLTPWLDVKVESGPPFGVFSYPKRYGARVHEIRGAIVFEIVIPF